MKFSPATPLMILLILVAQTPADAADEKPWSVDVALRFVQPTNLRTMYNLLDPNDDFDPEGIFIAPEFSMELSPELSIGRSLDDQSGFSVTGRSTRR